MNLMDKGEIDALKRAIRIAGKDLDQAMVYGLLGQLDLGFSPNVLKIAEQYSVEEFAAILINKKTKKIENERNESVKAKEEKEEKEEEQEFLEDRKAAVEDYQQDIIENKTLEEKQEERDSIISVLTEDEQPRIVIKGEMLKDLGDRQVEKTSYMLLKEMEKLAKGKETSDRELEIDVEFLKGLSPQQLAKQKKFLKAFGIEAKATGRNGDILEQDGREVSLETITQEELESGEISLQISGRALKGIDFARFESAFKLRGIELPETEAGRDTFEKGNKEQEEGPEI